MLEQTTSPGATQIIFFLNCLSSEYDMRKTSSYLSVNKLDYIFMGSEKIFSEVLAPCTLIKSDDENFSQITKAYILKNKKFSLLLNCHLIMEENSKVICKGTEHFFLKELANLRLYCTAAQEKEQCNLLYLEWP